MNMGSQFRNALCMSKAKGMDINMKSDRFIAVYSVLLMIIGTEDTIFGVLHPGMMWIVVLANAALVCWGCVKEQKIHSNTAIVYVTLSGGIILSMLFNRDIYGYTLFVFMGIAVLFTNLVEFDYFFKVFEIIVVWIAAFSLIGVAINYVCPELLEEIPDTRYMYMPAKNLFFTVVIPKVQESGNPFRNYGIFREPAMFCIYLGLACLRQFFYAEKLSVLRSGILILALILTKSTTGYIAIICLFAAYIVFKKRSITKTVISICGILGGGFVGIRFGLFSYFLERLNTAGASANSVNSRLYSIWIGGLVGFEHPLFGAGATKSNEAFAKWTELWNLDICWANMVTYLFASFGLLFILIFLAGIWGCGLKVGNAKCVSWITLIYVILLLCGESMTYSTIIYVFMMFGWKKIAQSASWRTEKYITKGRTAQKYAGK